MNISIPHIDGIKGIRRVPGDKSISHRALMIGAIGRGTTEIQASSAAADPLSTLSCLRQLGIQIDERPGGLTVYGKGLHGLRRSSGPLNAGNSGTTMRLLSGILAGQHFPSVISGDSSLSQRPMKRIIDPLQKMGARIFGTADNTAPLKIEPVDRLHGIRYELPVPSAQVKSAVIFAGLYAEGKTIILERVRSRDHTERMLGLRPSSDIDGAVEVSPDVQIEGQRFFIPGDISAAAFLLSAAMILEHSELKIPDVGINPTRKRIVEVFQSMGGSIDLENERTIGGEPIADILVRHSRLRTDLKLCGRDVVDLIDEIPILAATALFAEGSLVIRDARELRAKETDRISAIVHNLRSLGCQVEEYEDGFAFEGNAKLTGSGLKSFGDHRIAMAFGVAGLRVPNTTIEDAECVDISFPGFWDSLLGPGQGS
jgi:3-phosphoshikimate 1-carboxyvinyltransferase